MKGRGRIVCFLLYEMLFEQGQSEAVLEKRKIEAREKYGETYDGTFVWKAGI